MSQLSKAILLLVVLTATLEGCSPCRRAQKVLARCPALSADTTYVERIDTVITKEVTTDTVVSIDFDTVRIDTGSVQVMLIRRDSTIYIRATCKPDTIQVKGKDRVITKTIQAAPEAWTKGLWKYLLVAIALLLAAGYFIYALKK